MDHCHYFSLLIALQVWVKDKSISLAIPRQRVSIAVRAFLFSYKAEEEEEEITLHHPSHSNKSSYYAYVSLCFQKMFFHNSFKNCFQLLSVRKFSLCSTKVLYSSVQSKSMIKYFSCFQILCKIF